MTFSYAKEMASKTVLNLEALLHDWRGCKLDSGVLVLINSKKQRLQ